MWLVGLMWMEVCKVPFSRLRSTSRKVALLGEAVQVKLTERKLLRLFKKVVRVVSP